MSDDENDGNEEGRGEDSGRARNRTVMLTPDITSQVRSRLAQELSSDATAAAPQRSGGFQPAIGMFGATRTEGTGAGKVTQLPAPTIPAPTAPSEEGMIWVKESPIVGFLVAYDNNENGQVFELRSGRIMVTTNAKGGENSLVLTDESVSPMHAILRISANGEIQVLDQLSENGTKIERLGGGTSEVLSGEKGILNHGDIVSFGNRSFHVCIVPRVHGAA